MPQTKNVLHFVLSPWYFSNALIRLRRTFVAAATFSPREKGFLRLPCAQKKAAVDGQQRLQVIRGSSKFLECAFQSKIGAVQE